MKPDTHTFWDPEKGKYVTLGRCPKPQGSGVPTPAPTDDAEFRRKAVVAVDAVVTSGLRAFAKGVLWMIAAAVLFGIGTIFIPVQKEKPEWYKSAEAYLNRPWTTNAPVSSASDDAIRRQNDIALAKLHRNHSH